MKILILGIGNSLLSDEGVGIHVIQALQTVLADDPDVILLDGGTLSFTLAVPVSDADALIVVDAAQLRASPGALQTFEGEAMDSFLAGNGKSSVHEIGLSDLMTIAKLSGQWPVRRALVGIQPQSTDWGEAPTELVAAAIPEACRRIQDIIAAWRNGD